MAERSPILIAYDGSPAARAAVAEAGVLFAPGPAIVLTIWEPGLSDFMLVPDPAGVGTTMLPYDPAAVREVDRASENRAREIAHDGETLARAAGLDAQALAIRDATDTAAEILATADRREAAAIVLGTRGLTGLKPKLLGSTSLGVLAKSSRPVVVVRHPDDHDKR